MAWRADANSEINKYYGITSSGDPTLKTKIKMAKPTMSDITLSPGARDNLKTGAMMVGVLLTAPVSLPFLAGFYGAKGATALGKGIASELHTGDPTAAGAASAIQQKYQNDQSTVVGAFRVLFSAMKTAAKESLEQSSRTSFAVSPTSASEDEMSTVSLDEVSTEEREQTDEKVQNVFNFFDTIADSNDNFNMTVKPMPQPREGDASNRLDSPIIHVPQQNLYQEPGEHEGYFSKAENPFTERMTEGKKEEYRAFIAGGGGLLSAADDTTAQLGAGIQEKEVQKKEPSIQQEVTKTTSDSVAPTVRKAKGVSLRRLTVSVKPRSNSLSAEGRRVLPRNTETQVALGLDKNQTKMMNQFIGAKPADVEKMLQKDTAELATILEVLFKGMASDDKKVRDHASKHLDGMVDALNGVSRLEKNNFILELQKSDNKEIKVLPTKLNAYIALKENCSALLTSCSELKNAIISGDEDLCLSIIDTIPKKLQSLFTTDKGTPKQYTEAEKSVLSFALEGALRILKGVEGEEGINVCARMAEGSIQTFTERYGLK